MSPPPHDAVDDVEILLVDSNSDGVGPFTESFTDAHITNPIHVVDGGGDAIDFLNQRGDHADAPRPDLILLDLDLHGAIAEDVLAELEDRAELTTIPVIVLTNSADDAADLSGHDVPIDGHLVKPVDPDELLELARSVADLWIMIVAGPSRSSDR